MSRQILIKISQLVFVLFVPIVCLLILACIWKVPASASQETGFKNIIDLDQIKPYRPSTTCVKPPQNLVSWWTGDGTPEDIIDNNNGILVGDASYAPGMVGQAFSLDGDGDFVSINDAPSLNSPNMTIETWFNATDLDGQIYPPIIKKTGDGGGGSNGYSLEIGDHYVAFWVYMDDGYFHSATSISTIDINTWYHVAGTFDGSEIRLYLNGELQQVTSVTGNFIPSINPAYIGASPADPDRYFDGLIDEAHYFNRALNQSEIQSIYNAGASGLCQGVILDPPEQLVLGDRGETVQFIETLRNHTGITDTFHLSLGDSLWPVNLPVDTLGPIGDGQSSTFVVNMTVPTDAEWGMSSSVVVTATSNTEPATYKDTVVLITKAAHQCTDWNLASDFKVYPDQQNPNDDSCGNPAVWHFMRSDFSRQNFTLLDSFEHTIWGIEGLQQWEYSYDLPIVGINATGEDQEHEGQIWPAGVVSVHPSYSEYTVVGWQSPIEGNISVTGVVSDLNNTNGLCNGITWFIDKNDDSLVSGSFEDGGYQYFEDGNGGGQLENLSILPGDFLYFSIDPNGDACADATKLDIQIHAIEIKITGLQATNDSPTFVRDSTAFTATVTSGTNITYTWDFGDGTTGIGEFTNHVYAAPGTYTATVTAANSLGEMTATTEVVVLIIKNYLPVIIR